jgi:hypothetical protein
MSKAALAVLIALVFVVPAHAATRWKRERPARRGR